MSEFIFVYITCENNAQAEEIGSSLVEEGLAACANIYPSSTSIYRWEGRVQRTEECVVLLKTITSSFKKLEEKVISIHSYETPCILSFPVEKGSQKFLDWIKKETSN